MRHIPPGSVCPLLEHKPQVATREEGMYVSDNFFVKTFFHLFRRSSLIKKQIKSEEPRFLKYSDSLYIREMQIKTPS